MSTVRQRKGKEPAEKEVIVEAKVVTKEDLVYLNDEDIRDLDGTDVVIAAVFTVLGILTRFWRISEPGEVVFDEVHFLGFALNYVNREYFFDIHPPLGKFILAATTYFTGFDRDFKADEIGRKYADRPFVPIRATHAAFSGMTVPLPYLTLRAVGAKRTTSMLASCMVLFDGCLITNGRSIFMDSFLWFFLALSIFTAVQFWNLSDKLFAKRDNPGLQWYFWCILTGVSLGCTLSVKWTGLGVVGVIGVRQVYNFLSHLYYFSKSDRNTPRQRQLWRGAMFHLLAGIIMLVLIIVVYVVLFALHFIIANHTGPGIAWHVGDTKYMQTIIGTPEYEEMDPAFVHQQPSVLDKVWYIHKVMFDANRGITVDHPWSSKWYSWPFDVKGLMFWVQNNHMVYQLGNPFVWWGSTLMILLSILYSIHNTPFYTDPPQVLTSRKKMNQYQARLPYIERAKYEVAWLLFGYFCNLLPYVGVTRACWLYHYVPALFFGELAGCLWLDQLLRRSGNVRRFTTISVSVVLCVYGWWRFRAFTYAMHYTDDELDEMRWLSTWN